MTAARQKRKQYCGYAAAVAGLVLALSAGPLASAAAELLVVDWHTGSAIAGNPNVWLITGERLYPFYDRARLEKFAADSERLIAEAERKWPEVKRALSP
jgi:hypothetical protein